MYLRQRMKKPFRIEVTDYYFENLKTFLNTFNIKMYIRMILVNILCRLDTRNFRVARIASCNTREFSHPL